MLLTFSQKYIWFHQIQTRSRPPPPVLPADLKQRVRNLAEGAEFHGFHQLVKQVAVGHGDLLELLEARRRFGRVALVQQATR